MAPLAHTLALLAMTVATTAIEEVTLDMAPNSFDDQYRGCGPAMTAALPALKRSELQQNQNFARVWEKATDMWHTSRYLVTPLVSLDHAIALFAYTMGDLSEEFDAAVREAGRSRREYRDKFHFKALHFLLTDALARLRDTPVHECHCVVWKVDGVQFKIQPGAQTVRLGHFVSSSLCSDTVPDVGMGTVFEAQTCQGEDIREFSYTPSLKKVLIPPFETFKVTSVTQGWDQAWIQLRSTGNHSNYSCEWLRGGSVPRDPPLLGGLLLATTALAVATGIL